MDQERQRERERERETESTHLILWVVVLGEVGVSEGLLRSWSLVWVHLQQVREEVDGVRVGTHKELEEVFLGVVRERGHIVTSLGGEDRNQSAGRERVR